MTFVKVSVMVESLMGYADGMYVDLLSRSKTSVRCYLDFPGI